MMFSIIKGTTPFLNFTLDVQISEIQDLEIVFYQNTKLNFRKKLKDCTMVDSQRFFLILTEEDTFQLDDQLPLMVQLRAKYKQNDYIGASEIIKIEVKQSLFKGLMSGV